MTEQINPAAVIRYNAMNIMARREHSRQELQNKLSQKFPEFGNHIPGVLDKLENDGLLDDLRFAQFLVESYARKGKGPNQIKQRLHQKGVSDDFISQAFQEVDIDWFELAAQVLQKKFTEACPAHNYKEQSRQKRFLHYRGFTSDQIGHCFERS